MTFENNLENSLEDWSEWESDNGFFAPENIQTGETTQEEELLYATERAYRELEEAKERAETIDRMEQGQNVEFQFEYTKEDENYNEEAVSNENQLRDEFGYELADATLFAFKATTALQTGFESSDYEPNHAAMADAVKQTSENERTEKYEPTVRELLEKLDHKAESPSIYEEITSDDIDESMVARKVENVVQDLTRISSDLPRDMSSYISEKIRYNQSRSVEQMDADHPSTKEY